MKIDFTHKQSAHCENGVVANLLSHQGLHLSEQMVFGIGSGLFFAYLPFMKVNFAPGFSFRPMPGLIFKRTARLLGFKTKHARFRNNEKAQIALDNKIREGKPVGLQVGVFNLSYFPDDYRFHFNAHNLVVFGKENDQYLISDPVMTSSTQLHKDQLEKVRFAQGALAPRGHLYYIESINPNIHLPTAIIKGMRKTCNDMLAPVPIIGVKAIEWVAKNIKKWPKKIGIKKTNHYLGQLIRMQEEIGTGGAGFRYIYAAFLAESAPILHLPILQERAETLTKIGDKWRDFALQVSRVYKNRTTGHRLYEDLSDQLMEIARLERDFFTQLKEDIRVIK